MLHPAPLTFFIDALKKNALAYQTLALVRVRRTIGAHKRTTLSRVRITFQIKVLINKPHPNGKNNSKTTPCCIRQKTKTGDK